MKKTVIGIIAITSLLSAGLASAGTLSMNLAGYQGSVYFDILSGYSTTVLGGTPSPPPGNLPLGVVSGVFEIDSFGKTAGATNLFNSTPISSRIFGVFSGLTDTYNEFDAVDGEFYTEGKGGSLMLYELTAAQSTGIDLTNGPSVIPLITALGNERLFEATFDFIRQTVDVNYSPVSGSGFGTLSVVNNPGATLNGVFDSDSIFWRDGNPKGGTNEGYSDIFLGVTLDQYSGNAWAPWIPATGGGSFHTNGFGNMEAVPEPATMFLFGTGLIGLAGASRRRTRKK